MISASDIIAGLRGVIAVSVGRRDWLEAFDPDPAAIFRSFWAIPLATPFLVMSVEGGRRVQISEGEVSPTLDLPAAGFVVANAGILLFSWCLAIAILVAIGQRRSIGGRIGPLIMVQNWSNFLTYLLLALSLGIGVGGAVALSALASLFVLILAIWIDWGLFRRPLGFDIGGALIGVALLNIFFLSLSDILMSLVLALFLPSG